VPGNAVAVAVAEHGRPQFCCPSLHLSTIVSSHVSASCNGTHYDSGGRKKERKKAKQSVRQSVVCLPRTLLASDWLKVPQGSGTACSCSCSCSWPLHSTFCILYSILGFRIRRNQNQNKNIIVNPTPSTEKQKNRSSVTIFLSPLPFPSCADDRCSKAKRRSLEYTSWGDLPIGSRCT
jgi:hypothetical protein